MIRFTILCTGLFWMSAVWGQTETLLHMSCTVKDQTLIGIEDGRSKTLSGYSEGWKVGSTLDVTFSKGAHWMGKNPDQALNNFIEYRLENMRLPLDTVWWSDLKVQKEYQSDRKFLSARNFNWRQDEVSIRSVMTGETSLKLNRYYKSDWNGLLYTHLFSDDLLLVSTLDCRTIKNQLARAIQLVR